MAQKKLTYNEAVKEIEEILRKLENEEVNLDDLAENVKRVSFLLKFCKEKLHSTEEEVLKTLEDI